MTLKDWILATRPWSFAASALPALIAFLYMGKTYSFAHVDTLNGVLAILGAVIFHASGNLISDYFDFKHQVDRQDTIGATSIVSGLFTPRQILRFGQTLLAVGVLLGLVLALRSGWALLLVGALGILASGGYHLFKYHALGDLLIFVIYGPAIMLGVGWCMHSEWVWPLVWIAVPVSLITVNILHANNTRDIASDGQANIKTLAMLMGVRPSVWQYRVLLLIAYAAVPLMAWQGLLSWWSMLTYLTLPLAIRNSLLMGKISSDNMQPINQLDQGTAQLQLLFSGLLSISLLLWIWIG